MALRRLIPSSVMFLAVALLWAAEKKPAPAPDSKDKDYGGELPRIPPREPAEAMKTLVARPGFHAELVASEPEPSGQDGLIDRLLDETTRHALRPKWSDTAYLY